MASMAKQDQQQPNMAGATGLPRDEILSYTAAIPTGPAMHPSLQPSINYGGPSPSRVQTYRSRQSTGLGLTLIVFGVLAIVFNGVAIGVADNIGPVSHGFWCGAMFTITGGFGIAAGQRKTKCTIIAFMVLSIITAVLTSSLLAVGITGAVTAAQCDGFTDYVPSYGYHCGYDMSQYPSCAYSPPRCHLNKQWQVVSAMEGCLAVLGLLAAIVSIWGSAICCRAVCCCGQQVPNGMILSDPLHHQTVMIVYPHQHQTGGLPQGMQFYGGPPSAPSYAAAPPAYSVAQYWTSQQQQQQIQMPMQMQYQQQPIPVPCPIGAASTPPYVTAMTAANINYIAPHHLVSSASQNQQPVSAAGQSEQQTCEKY